MTDTNTYLMTQAVCALVDALGMTAENQERMRRGGAVAYRDDDFFILKTQYGIHHNAVIEMHRKGG